MFKPILAEQDLPKELVLHETFQLDFKVRLTLPHFSGHPNSLKIAEHKASAHIEDLILNVYTAYK